MKPVQHAPTPVAYEAMIKLTDDTGLLVRRETLNLNSLIAGAVKGAAGAAGINLRMDELPLVRAYAAPMQEALCLLLQAMLAQNEGCSKVYCYVQGAPAGPSLLDGHEDAGVYSVTIHTNAEGAGTDAAQHLLQEAKRLFAQNKIGLEHKCIPAGGVHFMLTLYRCMQPQTEPRQ
ncbi:hypothetical protein [Pseudocnuella soli]|uniref:hypothetical protein n=1 Tax=Pseudocnuella soli TaxID=2502779 RepID=UPI0010460378|nr:hypothetical protein [Pseudocnuella soli]